jgi:tRNA (guanine-N7-)-methyltransferase
MQDRLLRSFGRTRGRPLSARQSALVDVLLPRIGLPEIQEGQVDPASVMPGLSGCVLEIGFGGGEHLAAQASRAPDVLHIGAEPYLEGVAKLLVQVEKMSLANVRLVHGDGRPLLSALAPASLDRLVILFPDPWQKARHAKRRLIQPDVLDAAAQVLRPGGELRFATDWQAYADWTLALLGARADFREIAPLDRATPPADHVTTRYQLKQLGDCAPVFLRFERV